MNVRPVSRRALVWGAAFGALAAAFVGAIRFGLRNATLSGSGLAYVVAAEPLFTSFSLVDFLRQGRLELLNVPVQLASQFVNLVPSVIYPNKVSVMLTVQDLGYSARSPFGALSSYVSFLVNFGMVGTIVVLFLSSYALERLQHRPTALASVMYAMICSFIPFSLFRDPFYTSLVKSIFQLGMLMPLLVVGTLHVMSVALGTGPWAAPRRHRLDSARVATPGPR